jgi:tetratricopeptide (TPR) repeat protein/transcriptional regulator with XRE-family HTH domain
MKNQPFLFSSFGEQVTTYRKRAGLTQKQLAQLLGMHVNTMSAWELGTYLPHARGLVLELARHLHLDEQETRHLLEASLTALPPHWLVPLPRNPFFTGREEVLETLHRQLGVDQMVTLMQSSALYGLGGVGKTQIALEYSAVFWIGAETEEQVVSSLLHIAQELQLLERDNQDQQRIIAAVQRWLSTHTHWLLIWDNVEELTLLDRFLPSSRSGAVLITTRTQALGTLARGLNLSPMEQEEGVLFLLRRAKILEPEATDEHVQQYMAYFPSHYAAAVEIVTTLGGLPLALDQAGAYLEETGCSLVGYMQRYQQQAQQMLARRGSNSTGHPHSVTITFQLSYERMQQSHPEAAELLRACSFLASDGIPEDLFVKGASHLGPVLSRVVTDPLQLDQALAALQSLSLLKRHTESQMLSLHRLVQVVLREGMGEHERTMWMRRVIVVLNALFPSGKIDVWEQCEQLLPHVLVSAEATPDQLGGLELADVLQKAATYLLNRGQDQQTEMYRRALRIREQALGPEHLQVADALYWMGNVYSDQGAYEQAERLYRRALRVKEQVLGPEHSSLAFETQELATLYYHQKKYQQAEALYRRASYLWEQALGPDFVQIAYSLNGLANIFRDQVRYAEAESLYERALSIRERHLGPQHPETAQTLYDLAVFQQRQGNLNAAICLAERTYKIRSQSLGDAHPKTIAARALSAQLLKEQASALEKTTVKRGKGEMPTPRIKEGQAEKVQGPLHADGDPSFSDNDPLQRFLDACCEFHPRAWCRSADLWQAYERWVQQQQERFPLSRRALGVQLKARGYRADHTRTARIWRGITLIHDV